MLLLILLVQAAQVVARAGGQAVENLLFAEQSGTLVLHVTFDPGGETWSYSMGHHVAEASWFGEFADESAPYCFDACNGITTVHRGTYCRFNPEHADLDCGCAEGGDEWDDFLDDDEATAEFVAYLDRKETAAVEAAHGIEEEPF